MRQNAAYFNKANQHYSFFNSVFKKIASKIDKHVMLSYWLLYNKRGLEFDFFKLYPKFPRVRAKQTRWNFAAFAYYHREKPNFKSLS